MSLSPQQIQTLFQQNSQVLDGLLYKLKCYPQSQRVKNDVLELLKNLHSLQLRQGVLRKNETIPSLFQILLAKQGASPNQIICLAGTIPVVFNDVSYNIPVNIWIPENYPYNAPFCYVTPTPGNLSNHYKHKFTSKDMVIKPRHRHVDSSGMCYLPYLSSWNPNSANLVNLVSVMSKIFGQDPPVRSQTSTATNPSTTPAKATQPPPVIN
jgi:ESCRT-I complex subunit TSG101